MSDRKAYIKTCIYCGQEFTTKTKATRYCSLSCAGKVNTKVKNVFTCKHCGKEYHAKSKDRNTYCSRECAFRDKAKKCITCGKPIIGNSGDYCSKECKQVVRTCQACGKEFMGYKLAVYCGDKCRKKVSCIKTYEYSRALHDQSVRPRKCKECGETFIPEYGSKHRTFCSNECAHKFFSRQHKEARREQMRRLFVEPVSFTVIYKRDKGICQICCQPVAFDKTPEDSMGATIDHIIPLSKGGKHHRDNCQLAHRLCNSIKGDKIAEIVGINGLRGVGRSTSPRS